MEPAEIMGTWYFELIAWMQAFHKDTWRDYQEHVLKIHEAYHIDPAQLLECVDKCSDRQ